MYSPDDASSGLPALGEKLLQELPATIGQDALDHLDVVIEQAFRKKGDFRAHGTCLFIPSPEDELLDSSPDQGSGAHGAGLQGDVDFQIVETVVR